jgi:hypothetical protein
LPLRVEFISIRLYLEEFDAKVRQAVDTAPSCCGRQRTNSTEIAWAPWMTPTDTRGTCPRTSKMFRSKRPKVL